MWVGEARAAGNEWPDWPRRNCKPSWRAPAPARPYYVSSFPQKLGGQTLKHGDDSAACMGAPWPLQARRFVEEGHHLRLVVAFKGGVEQALGREMVAFLLEQLEGEAAWPGLLVGWGSASGRESVGRGAGWEGLETWGVGGSAFSCGAQAASRRLAGHMSAEPGTAAVPSSVGQGVKAPIQWPSTPPSLPSTGLVVVRNEKSLEKPLGNHFAVLLTPIKENNKPPTGKPEA